MNSYLIEFVRKVIFYTVDLIRYCYHFIMGNQDY
jgi:hypothetical protein